MSIHTAHHYTYTHEHAAFTHTHSHLQSRAQHGEWAPPEGEEVLLAALVAIVLDWHVLALVAAEVADAVVDPHAVLQLLWSCVCVV
jgi:hypothetical protein